MANIPFKSITFPGLPNKYTVPEISSDLMTAGKAADAKATGDALSALEDQFTEETDQLKADLDAQVTDLKSVLNPYIILSEMPTVVGAVSAVNGEDTYGSTARRTDYIDVSGYDKIAYTRIASTTESGKVGMAFYDAEKIYIIGQTLAYGADTSGYEISVLNVPKNAVYARFTWNINLDSPFVLYDTLPFDDEDLYKKIFAFGNIFKTTNTGGVSAIDGTNVVGSSTRRTEYINVSSYNKIAYTRVKLKTASGNIGMAFYETNDPSTFIIGQTFAYGSDSFGYEIAIIDVPSNANYARFTWNIDIDSPFTLYDAEQFTNTLQYQIDEINNKFPNYSGKRVSILGDSISTFVPASDKVDGKAPEGCTTTYPGNVTKYEASNVTSEELTWWGRVIAHFGMTLGINESWAGSTIGYNPNYTNSGKYTADNCMCSETRIGHLGESGTPDVIIVFGGTNDINHHMSGSNVRFAVGELDSVHNPYDFENFPMITDTYYGAITTMLLRIQHTYPNATILMLLPFFCTSTHTSATDVATPYDQNTWSNVAIDVCKYLGVEYLDLRKIINLYDVSSLLFDGLHPNANGMKAIANAVVHKLNDML